jgi:hypothetical protein
VRKLILLFIPLVSFSQTFELTNGQSIDLINPKKNVGIKNWNIVNDDVMGGVSISYLSINTNYDLDKTTDVPLTLVILNLSKINGLK